MFNGTYKSFDKNFQPHNKTKPYSVILYNSVWMSAHKLFNLNIPEKQSLSSYDVIEFTQVRNGTEIRLVDINGSDITFFDDKIKDIVISDEFEMRFEGASTG